MKNKTQQALDMIISGYSLEVVMDVLGLEKEDLYNILDDILGDHMDCIWITQTFNLRSIGTFDMNVN